MTNTEAVADREWLEEEAKSASDQLRDLIREMRGLQDRARDGDISVTADAVKTVRDVRQFLSIAAATEAKLAEFRQYDSGGAGQFALDLDGARASIRCRLDRLRRCHGAG